jgi:hypothetical protein
MARVILTLCILAFYCGPECFAQPSREYQVKAAFLLNFAQFVEWPAATFAATNQPFTVGVLGDDPFGPALEQTVQGETIHGHPVVLRRASRPEDLKDCQLIFISKSEHARFGDILPQCTGRGILTVSEFPGFAAHGGMINFYLDGKKVRFEINPTAAQHEGLRVSSQLLNLGKIVATQNP